MPVLAVFDAQANWRDTHVCDGWITEHLAKQGVSWGRGEAKKGQRALDGAGLFYLPTATDIWGCCSKGASGFPFLPTSRISSMLGRLKLSTDCLLSCRCSRPSLKKCCR
jgi:hypothetical protein